MSYWFVFALCGAMALPVILMFALMCDTVKNKIIGSIVCVCFWFLIAGAMWGQADTNAKAWNDGFCECGTHWELKGASKYRSSETKYYSCPNCYAEIELNY